MEFDLELDALELLAEEEPAGLDRCSETCWFTCTWTA
ncbi:hypothetical protein BX266_0705 [Streptomyces sp. TLI_171]|nr:hypothetical protein BX266_0704 [Streptomyces sp. TLI_171]RKE17447.1 hypothetical protein BX266_0705 [Streptomyces sp. TLI_171]